jgi:uncharacterized membrane protein YhaH (DUF805 family)
MNWYLTVLKKYAVFSGRARRKEYWFFILFHILVIIGLSIIETMLGMGGETAGYGMLTLIYTLAVFLPALGVTIRRLHDSDRSGWWVLIGFVPLIGGIVLLIFMILPGTSGSNRFGPDPIGQGEP